MPFGTDLWILDIEKERLGEYWTNRYIMQGPSLASMVTAAAEYVALERTFHKTDVLFIKYRVSDGVPLTDSYQVVNINTFGQVATSAEHLPLFNVVRVDFNTANGGRPSRKYYRLPLLETEVTGGNLATAFIATIQTAADAFAARSDYVDVDGQSLVNGSVYPRVGMRQLRRGSKRASAPSGT